MGNLSGCSAFIKAMYYFEDLIEDIERSLASEIDIALLAQKMNASVYEFRRMFTFITKQSIGDYIRKRRLSAAAIELYEGEVNVTELSLKYGYDSPASFSRAFKEFHGITPAAVAKGNSSFRLVSKLNAQISISGGCDIEYRMLKKDAFTVSGFLGRSDMTDTECCENVWSSFYASQVSERIIKNSGSIFAVYQNNGDEVACLIGALNADEENSIEVPSSDWVCFKLFGTADEYVNEFYCNVLSGWLASTPYKRNNDIPNIEVYPANMGDEDFEWEVWIPILKGE